MSTYRGLIIIDHQADCGRLPLGGRAPALSSLACSIAAWWKYSGCGDKARAKKALSPFPASKRGIGLADFSGCWQVLAKEDKAYIAW